MVGYRELRWSALDTSVARALFMHTEWMRESPRVFLSMKLSLYPFGGSFFTLRALYSSGDTTIAQYIPFLIYIYIFFFFPRLWICLRAFEITPTDISLADLLFVLGYSSRYTIYSPRALHKNEEENLCVCCGECYFSTELMRARFSLSLSHSSPRLCNAYVLADSFIPSI